VGVALRDLRLIFKFEKQTCPSWKSLRPRGRGAALGVYPEEDDDMQRSETMLAAALLCLSCGSSGSGPQGGGSETWTGQLTGTALGAFVCISGTDGWYDESSQLSLVAPSPGLVSLMNTAQYPTNLNGTFSNTETAHENSGFACAPQPSVVSTTTPSTAVSIRALQNQLMVTAGSILIPAHFRYSTTWDAFDTAMSPSMLGQADNRKRPRCVGRVEEVPSQNDACLRTVVSEGRCPTSRVRTGSVLPGQALQVPENAPLGASHRWWRRRSQRAPAA